MKIRDIQMNMSAVKKEQYPDDKMPQIAFVGRSNVGKSSMINTLLNRKNMARVSQTPGKTRTINFFKINEEFYLVDLPGYGYAKLSKQEKESWGKVMEDYFVHCQDLVHVFVLVDIRHEPKDSDKQMVEYIRYHNLPLSVIATKSDKLTRNEQNKSLKVISQTLAVPMSEIFMLSSLKKTGQDEIWERIIAIYAENGFEITQE
ncbi:MAG: ribosome biogenesis GTP-binding protein YihA/YsxC [Peptostreptococcaceae bacterium]|nr:ribosome biogenesis GTP-binding protein YihA/YsxC [Peptostreptococcaceae bacterium]